MRRRGLATSLVFAFATATPSLAGAARTPVPASAPAPGLAFALALKGSGEVLASGPFLLRVPGGNGPLRLALGRISVDGARLTAEVSLRNDSGLLLAGVSLDFVSATPVPRDAAKTGAPESVPLALRAPLAIGDLLPGETTPGIPIELAPVPLGGDVGLTTVLGAVSGLAVEPPVSVEGAVRPVALDVDRSGRLYVACGGVGRVLRFSPASAGAPTEAARSASPPTGIALHRKSGDLLVATGDRLIEVHRAGRNRPSSLDAERPVGRLRTDGKDVLRAAAGNGVLAFDGARPGRVQALGPEGTTVVSFDSDASGLLYAVVCGADGCGVVAGRPGRAAPFGSRKGPGADALDAPIACRVDGEGSLWVAAAPRAPENAVVARFSADGTPLVSLSRAALALLLGKDEESAVPAIVDLAAGPDQRLFALLESGALLVLRPF